MKVRFWATILLMIVLTELCFAQRPNVIYIYADDLGYGELGSYGQEKIKTPHLDKLAAEGMRFTQHYSSAPVCAPSRAMLMTGLHSGHAAIRGNYELGGFEDNNEGGQMPLPANSFTIADLMKTAGYTTAMIGKWGLGMHTGTGDPLKHGFDYYYGYLCQKQAHNLYPSHLWENGKWDTLKNPAIKIHESIPMNAPDSFFTRYTGSEYAISKMSDKTVEWITGNQSKPFFLYLPFTGPHLSLQAPEEAVAEYRGQFEEEPYYGDKGYVANKYPRSTYAAMVTYFDKQVGRIMQLLQELGLDKNTIVIFSSDNGTTFDTGGYEGDFFNATAGLRGRKRDLYEGGIRVPLIVRWPMQIKAGSVSNHISAQYDMMATLADLVNTKAPANDGLSFFPTLMGKVQKQHEFLYFEFPEAQGQIAIRMGKWKAVKSNLKKNPKAEWEIYDLEKDPFEKNNIAATHSSLFKKLNQIVVSQHIAPVLPEWELIK